MSAEELLHRIINFSKSKQQIKTNLLKIPKLLVGSSSLSLLLLSTFFLSCAGLKTFRDDSYMSRDTARKSFVQTTDGTITEADEAVVRSPFFKKSFIELDKSTRIPTSDVIAYQNSQAYYRNIGGQFAPRIKKGLINLYRTNEMYQDYSPSPNSIGGMSGTGWKTRTRIVYYLQKGDSANVRRFSPAATKLYVQDYAPAMQFINVFETTERKVKMWSWINTGVVVGSLFLASQGVKGDKATAPAYAGVGLLFGGIVNGVVNRIRKAKNYANQELAIDEYNRQRVKKKKDRVVQMPSSF